MVYGDKDRNLRLKTWPLAAFLFGLLVTPGISVLVGVLCGLAAVPVALFANLWGRPTRSRLPLTGKNPTNDMLFIASLAAAIALQLAGYWMAVSMVIAMIPSILVLGGGRVEEPTEDAEHESSELVEAASPKRIGIDADEEATIDGGRLFIDAFLYATVSIFLFFAIEGGRVMSGGPPFNGMWWAWVLCLALFPVVATFIIVFPLSLLIGLARRKPSVRRSYIHSATAANGVLIVWYGGLLLSRFTS